VLTFGRETKYPHEDGTHAAFADGHVDFVSSDTPIEERRAMITIARDERAAAATRSAEVQ
jgi:prepilin-type processing-associated H-X9-DG protein